MKSNKVTNASIDDIVLTLNRMLAVCDVSECMFSTCEEFINSWQVKTSAGSNMLRKYGYTGENAVEDFKVDLLDAINDNDHVNFEFNPFNDVFEWH